MFKKGYKMSEETKKRVSEARKRYHAVGKLNKNQRRDLFPWERTLDNIGKRIYGKTTYARKGIKCDLTIKQLEKLWKRDKAHLLSRPSLDRKDNDGHYTYKNCRYIEFNLNSGRSNIGNTRRRGSTVPIKTRKIISLKVKALWRDPEYRKMQIKAHRKVNNE